MNVKIRYVIVNITVDNERENTGECVHQAAFEASGRKRKVRSSKRSANMECQIVTVITNSGEIEKATGV